MVLELQSSVLRAGPDAAPLTSLRRGPFSITAFSTGAACVFVINLNGGFAVITATDRITISGVMRSAWKMIPRFFNLLVFHLGSSEHFDPKYIEACRPIPLFPNRSTDTTRRV